MAHFAQLDENNVVLQVIVVHNNELIDENNQESEAKGIAFCQSLFPNTKWVQTSYNGSFRKHFAGIGSTYDPNRNAFIPRQPYKSWILNEETLLWEAPVPMPQDGKSYQWDGGKLSWVEVQK